MSEQFPKFGTAGEEGDAHEVTNNFPEQIDQSPALARAEQFWNALSPEDMGRIIVESPFNDEEFASLTEADQSVAMELAVNSSAVAGMASEGVPAAGATEVAAEFALQTDDSLGARAMKWGRALGAGLVMGAAATGAAGADHDHNKNIFKQFGDIVAREVKSDVREAARDSGAVIGGATRIVIDRTINRAVVGGLNAAGVPVVQMPEEVVVVPRSVPGVGYGVPAYEGRVGSYDNPRDFGSRAERNEYAQRIQELNGLREAYNQRLALARSDAATLRQLEEKSRYHYDPVLETALQTRRANLQNTYAEVANLRNRIIQLESGR